MERQTARPYPPFNPSASAVFNAGYDHHLERLLRQWRHLRRELSRQLSVNLAPALFERQARISSSQTRPLCQHLIDYLFIGHFVVYPGLALNATAIGVEERNIVRGNYRNITASTDQALAFNDRYGRHDQQGGALVEDVSKLNQALLVRYVLEEQLTDLLL